jgi:hypothetical protein
MGESLLGFHPNTGRRCHPARRPLPLENHSFGFMKVEKRKDPALLQCGFFLLYKYKIPHAFRSSTNYIRDRSRASISPLFSIHYTMLSCCRYVHNNFLRHN